MAFRAADSEIRNPDGSIVFQLEPRSTFRQHWSQVAADVLAQKYFRKAGVAARLKKIAESDVPEWLWRSVPDEAALAELPAEQRYGGEQQCRARSSTAWPAPGPTGAGRAATSTARTTPAPSTTSIATCWRRRCARPTRRNGSTPACIGPTASTARARATTTSITATASPIRPSRPTSIRSRTPASSRASPTIWSTKAASWTCGCARRACSNTAPAPAPTSPSCAAKASSCRAAASPPA